MTKVALHVRVKFKGLALSDRVHPELSYHLSEDGKISANIVVKVPRVAKPEILVFYRIYMVKAGLVGIVVEKKLGLMVNPLDTMQIDITGALLADKSYHILKYGRN